MMHFLRNSWYCIGWSDNFSTEPLGRKILREHIVAYRDEAGEVVALGGRCPHRFAPMAKGRVTGNDISCPYHGLRFNSDGQCVYSPHGDGRVPPNTTLPVYKVLERDGAVWIWMGDAEKADPALAASPEWLTSPEYASFTGHLRVPANYQLVIDNLLDLSHAPYLHANTLGGNPEDTVEGDMDHDFHTEDGNIIHSNYFVSSMKPTPQLLPLWGTEVGDFRAEMRWRPASTLELDIRMSPPGADRQEGVHVPSLHFLAPESDTSTLYFFAMGINVQIEDEEQTRLMAQFARTAFEEEDEPMIRECQELMGTTDLFSLKPVVLQSDIAGVQVRRLLAKMIRAEEKEVDT